MFLLFCSKTDLEAIWLYKKLTAKIDFDSEILFAEDLYDCKGWMLRVNNSMSFAEVVSPAGRKINTENVTLFINRVNNLNHPFWAKKEVSERQYFHQEWNAFLLGWLQAFQPVLINKISPTSFSGFGGSPLRWSLMARKAGFILKPQSYLSASKNIEYLFTSQVSKRSRSLLVYRRKVYCDLDLAGLSGKCLRLASVCECDLLEVFVEKKRDGHFKFITATSLPAFSKFSQSFVQAFRHSVIEAQENIPHEKKIENLINSL
ncbi:MAG: hypothetical protein ABI683_15415 [Ginsengibacter sp.]